MNRLLFGDNLPLLRDQRMFPDESADLIYLDPPFNSNAEYNVLFKESSGEESRAQFHAFTDTWHWTDAEPTYREFVQTGRIVTAVSALESFKSMLGTSSLMAYLAMMAPRLVELHRILKPTGSLYLHCDPTASHYLKVLLDAIFEPHSFVNEVIWKRSGAHSDRAQGAKHFGRIHDVLLVYAKTDAYVWNQQSQPQSDRYVASHYTHVEPGTGRQYRLDNLTGPGGAAKGNPSYEVMGVTRFWRYSHERMKALIDAGRVVQTKPGSVPQYKRYLDESAGRPLQDIWDDLPPINSQAAERLGYPTQKPVALMERIVATSSNEGDVVLDPFCGCGTTIAAAQKLNRQWTGIDITYLAINLIKRRLDSAFGKGVVQYVEHGQPDDLTGAKALAKLDRFQFQQWALNLINALPVKAGSGKGKDGGIDGLLSFYESKDERRKVLVQVKSGHVAPSDIAALIGDVDNHKAAGGIFITLEAPTADMRKKAVEAGRYMSATWGKTDYPKVQIRTIQQLLDGTEPDVPPLQDPFSKAPPVEIADQLKLLE